MELENMRKEVARNLSVETIKQRGLLNKTDWTPERIVEELDKIYKSFYETMKKSL